MKGVLPERQVIVRAQNLRVRRVRRCVAHRRGLLRRRLSRMANGARGRPDVFVARCHAFRRPPTGELHAVLRRHRQVTNPRAHLLRGNREHRSHASSGDQRNNAYAAPGFDRELHQCCRSASAHSSVLRARRDRRLVISRPCPSRTPLSAGRPILPRWCK